MNIYFYRDNNQDIIVVLKDNSQNGIVILDENILTYHAKIVLKNDFFPINGSIFDIYSKIDKYYCSIEYKYKPTPKYHRPTLYDLYGEGIEGNIIENSDIEYQKLSNFGKPLILFTDFHEYFFTIVSRKTLIYMETSVGLESVFNGWNMLYNFDKKPKYNNKGKQKLESIISPNDIVFVKKLCDHSEGSPINFLMRKMGYDYIIVLNRLKLYILNK